ncbi:MAG: transcription termination/antitermination protein NusG [Candidatus Promineifilaceae bacterium]
MADKWYALHVKAHKEQMVHDYLVSQGIADYYPYLRIEPVNPRSRKQKPFFPGYVFVRLDVDELGPNALRWTEGTYGLVSFGDEPAPVPDSLINGVRRRVEEVNAAGESVGPAMEPGDRVRIVEGAFEGYEAIFDANLAGKERVQVLLSYLSQQPKRLIIKPEQVQKIDK